MDNMYSKQNIKQIWKTLIVIGKDFFIKNIEISILFLYFFIAPWLFSTSLSDGYSSVFTMLERLFEKIEEMGTIGAWGVVGVPIFFMVLLKILERYQGYDGKIFQYSKNTTIFLAKKSTDFFAKIAALSLGLFLMSLFSWWQDRVLVVYFSGFLCDISTTCVSCP